MSREDVLRLAKAIAAANGHDDSDAWATKVADAFDALEPTPADTASTLTTETT